MSMSVQDVTYEEAHIHDNRAYQLVVPLAIFGFVAFSCVVLRPVARRLSGAFLWLDDWLILASMARFLDDVEDVTETDQSVVAVFWNCARYHSMSQ